MRASYALPGIFPPVELDGRPLVDDALVNPVPVSVCRAIGGPPGHCREPERRHAGQRTGAKWRRANLQRAK
ncbi:MAG: hypothetical protein VCF08_11405 [Alphaproteobacteria bacterium]